MTLTIENLTVRYGAVEAVRNVTLPPIAAGTLTALVGPNAAGKSSLLKAVAGLGPAVSGRVTCGGVSLHGLPLRDRAEHVRYVPQSYATSVRLPVLNAVLVARLAGRRGRAPAGELADAAHALDRVGIAHLADKETWALSGGQQQLVALAMGLARPAPALLLDEPTSALDLRHQLFALEVARRAAVEGEVAVVVAMHDLNLAARHADRVVLMAEGLVVADGPPVEVLSSPRCAAAYGVRIEIGTTRRGSPVVEAYL